MPKALFKEEMDRKKKTKMAMKTYKGRVENRTRRRMISSENRTGRITKETNYLNRVKL